MPAPRKLANLATDPHFVFHLKRGVISDLPAVATVITDPQERRRVFTEFVDDFNARRGPDSPWPHARLDEWVRGSLLARVSFGPATDRQPDGGRQVCDRYERHRQVGTQSNFTSSFIDHAGIAVEPLTGVAFSVTRRGSWP